MLFKRERLMRTILTFLLFGFIGFITMQGCKDDSFKGPLSPEPIRVHKPDSLIVLLPSDTTIPIELEMLLPATLDSLTGEYQVGRSPFIPLFSKSYPDTSNRGTYSGEFTVPDSLEDGTILRCLFTAYDVNDSTYLKTLRIDIENE